MTAPVVWIPRETEGPLQAGQEWTSLTHGGPHPGTLTARERRAYRFTFGLTLWVQALFLITMWALKFVYAGAQSPLGTVSGAVGGGVALLMVHGILLGYAATGAARAGDQRRAAKLALGMIGIGLITLGGIAFDWDWIGLSG
ncbi:MAG TPA: hypothetical protein VE197_17070, partial [Mycobacterium sp.]|nr:hypothetical protein [Mycobacterium sp.]